MSSRITLAIVLMLTAWNASALPTAPADAKPDVAHALDVARHRLSALKWRMKTEMRVDGEIRLTKVEDVHLGPDGDLVKAKVVRYDKKPAPTPLPYGDPRSRLGPPPTDAEEETLFAQAQALMQLYLRLSPDSVAEWARGAQLLPELSERPGQRALRGRGLGRTLDEAILYLEASSQTAREIEVKTTVSDAVVDIAFLRVSFEPRSLPAVSQKPVVVPKSVFLNMDRGKRRVRLEMEMSDFQSWP